LWNFSGTFLKIKRAVVKGVKTMVCFSRDVDILKYEPALFGELYLPGQVIMQDSGGRLAGDKFTVSETDFVDDSVEAGGVIYLKTANGAIDGAFEIVSVDSETKLTVSVVRTEEQGETIAIGDSEDVSYRIVTYRPQAEEAVFRLTEYLGIRPGNSCSDIGADDIPDKSAIRRLSVFLVLSNLYAMLGGEMGNDGYWKKSRYYKEQFDKAKERCRVSIDLGKDGVSDITIHGGAGRLVRD